MTISGGLQFMTPHNASLNNMSSASSRQEALVEAIDALLPQTQCGECGYAGCKPYAQALADGEAEINRCPPGGMDGVQRLADLLGRPVKPLLGETKPKQIALIDEAACIGCTLCIQACPVDAIVGAARQMHTVVAEWCTGCELCVAPCPVDCIRMQPIEDVSRSREHAKKIADAAKARFELRKLREAREVYAKAEKTGLNKAGALAPSAPDTAANKRAIIAAAIERARQRTAAGQVKKSLS
jgi:electron transport complex protein RnfB